MENSNIIFSRGNGPQYSLKDFEFENLRQTQNQWILLSKLLSNYLQQWIVVDTISNERKDLEEKIKYVQNIILLENPNIVKVFSSAIVILKKLSSSEEFLRYTQFFVQILKKEEDIYESFLELDEKINHYHNNLKQ